MKTNTILTLLAILITTGCKTSNNLTRDLHSEYRTDQQYFRAVGQDKDPDRQRAHSKALLNAKVDIARSAGSVCQMLALDYLQQTQQQQDITLKEQFLTISMESVSQSLTNVIEEDAIYQKDKDGTYTCYVKIKVQRTNVIDTFTTDLKQKTTLNEDIFKQATDKILTDINKTQK